MQSFPTLSLALVSALLTGLSPWDSFAAQDRIETPSQQTRDALKKFSQIPSTIGKGLETLKEKAVEGIRDAVGGKPSADGETKDSTSLPKLSDQPSNRPVAPVIRRDPFQPMTVQTKRRPQPRENLTPLERFELGQLKLVGIIWDAKEPRAMVEDSAGLGYIVIVGTPIGSNEGKVKAIRPTEVVVQEFYTDFYGQTKPREVSIRLAVE